MDEFLKDINWIPVGPIFWCRLQVFRAFVGQFDPNFRIFGLHSLFKISMRTNKKALLNSGLIGRKLMSLISTKGGPLKWLGGQISELESLFPPKATIVLSYRCKSLKYSCKKN